MMTAHNCFTLPLFHISALKLLASGDALLYYFAESSHRVPLPHTRDTERGHPFPLQAQKTVQCNGANTQIPQNNQVPVNMFI